MRQTSGTPLSLIQAIRNGLVRAQEQKLSITDDRTAEIIFTDVKDFMAQKFCGSFMSPKRTNLQPSDLLDCVGSLWERLTGDDFGSKSYRIKKK